MPLTKPIVFEQGDKFYFVGPLAPVQPSTQDIEEYAFGKSIIESLREKAPNEHIAWFGGHYVEADAPNLNGAMWRSSEIALKGLTPMFMPVTVMHDPRTAVGLIADLRLLTPEKDSVPRPKIDTALALWKHRFPDVVSEAHHNYAAGTLMQSMECLAPDYECSECGAHFHKLPDGAERENWCAHLKGENGSTPVRILRSVVFTGTGLIFGTRGAEGADPNAYLESFQQEVAEFHQRVHSDTRRKPRRQRSMDEITLAKAEYDRLVRERDDFKARAEAAEKDRSDAEKAKADAEKEQEAAEAAKVKAETENADLKKQVTDFEEKARQGTLRDERFEALGKSFVAKLGDKTRGRLRDQAAAMSDEDWTARLEELEELVGVKSDAADDSGDGDGGKDETASRKGSGEFSAEEIARSRAGRSNGGATEQSPAARKSVVAGLLSKK